MLQALIDKAQHDARAAEKREDELRSQRDAAIAEAATARQALAKVRRTPLRPQARRA